MDYYFVAKNKTGGYIGQFTLEDIVQQLRDGMLSDDYVAARTFGDSYQQVMNAGIADWVTVAELVADQPTQPINIQPVSRQVSAITTRYNDGYLVAVTTNGIGEIIKGIGVVLAVLSILTGLALALNGRAGDATFALGLALMISGAVSGLWFYIAGILVSAQGQLLKASLDSAVNSSPFLTNEHRAQIMSLPNS